MILEREQNLKKIRSPLVMNNMYMSDILKLDIYFTTKLERFDLYVGMQKC